MALIRIFTVQQAAFAALHASCVLLGLAPFNIWPLAPVSVFFIFCAARAQESMPLRHVFLSGALFALMLTLITFHWMIATIHRYTGETWALTLLLSLCYAFFFQLKPFFFFIISRYLPVNRAGGLTHGLAAAALLATIDAASPELFPWSWGNAFAGEDFFRQLASVGSVYLNSFTVCFLGWLIFDFAVRRRGEKMRVRWSAARPALAFAAILFATGVGLWYLHPAESRQGSIRTLVVQTNIGAAPEAKRSDAAFATEAINRLFNRSLEGLLTYAQTDVIFWPEASMPFHAAAKIPENAAIYSQTFDGVIEYLTRLSGASVVYQDMTYRSAALHSQMASRPGTDTAYLKRRLVPWGEYLPGEFFFPALRRFFPEAGRFRPGHETGEMRLTIGEHPSHIDRNRLAADVPLLNNPDLIRSRLPLAAPRRTLVMKPLLCYEALFPSDARTRDADLIANLSSDAWFGDGIEGHQHAFATALRAVENGVPMVRAAMSGISMVFDNRGNLVGRQTGQGRSDNLFTEMTLEKRRTVFSRFGMAAFYLLMFAAAWPFFLERFLAMRTARSSRTRKNK